MQTSIRFTILGGDARMRACAEGLRKLGYEALDLPQPAWEVLHRRLLYTDVLILPLPAFSGKQIHSTQIDFSMLLDHVSNHTLIFAGLVPPQLHQRIIDYNQDEHFQYSSAIATAEGTIEILLHHLPFTLHGSHGLIIGYGRIGKALSQRLVALGMQITVSVRKQSDRQAIQAQGMLADLTGEYHNGLDYDCIINTVPAQILSAEALQRLSPDTLIVDLASRPGGLDWEASHALGLNAIHALGLPGKVSPITSGLAIRDTVLEHLNLH